MSDSEIFDRALRRVRRDRAAQLPERDDRLIRWMERDILDRLQDVRRPVDAALVLNGAATGVAAVLRAAGTKVTVADPGPIFAEQAGGLVIDEDRYPFAAQSFDLIVALGLLDTVNDVPGALILMRRALRPGALMYCSFAGAESLSQLRETLRIIEPMVQRMHPMIDVRAGGDLLARAGFAQSVADVDAVPVKCADFHDYIHLVRSLGAANLLSTRQPMRRDVARALRAAFEQHQPIEDIINVVTLTGWAEKSDQLVEETDEWPIGRGHIE